MSRLKRNKPENRVIMSSMSCFIVQLSTRKNKLEIIYKIENFHSVWLGIR